MPPTVNLTIRELVESTMQTLAALLDAADQELPMPSSHVCAQDKDVWTLITNDIDHEKIHTGQVLEGRYESRITPAPMARLIAEWMEERARFIGALVGLTDEQFNQETSPGGWTYRAVAKHVFAVEQDSLKTIATDRAARTRPEHHRPSTQHPALRHPDTPTPRHSEPIPPFVPSSLRIP
jgi:uncharacterized damage-inducible protein DinB